MSKKHKTEKIAAAPSAEKPSAAKKSGKKATERTKAKAKTSPKTTEAPKAKKALPAKTAPKAAAKPKETAKPSFTADDIALRAYFIAEKRRMEGKSGDEAGDWIEAERQLIAESKPKRSSTSKKA